MNKIQFLPKILYNFAANSHINHRLLAKNGIPKCNSHQLIRFFSSTEESIENKDISEPLSDRVRNVVITPEQSIKYLESDAYKGTYGHHKVWHLYRRNFKGQFSPFRSRGNCIVEGMVWTTNPCPICRDQYLVLHYSNISLINQFISPETGYVYENTVLCLCSEQYEQLLVAINLAKNYGLITFEVPLRTYDYNDYYKDFRHNHNCNQH